MGDTLTKISWSLFKRYRLAKKLQGFWASAWSFADINCNFAPYVRIYRGAFLRSVTVGEMTYFARNAQIDNVTLGKYCCIGPEVILGGLGRHPVNRLSTHPTFYSSQLRAGQTFADTTSFEELPHTILGNDVWVGVRAVILDGVTVGDGAVIGAGALVNKDVPPYAIVAGVPARLIRYRFDEEVVKKLLSWQWWNLPYYVLRRKAVLMGQKESWTIAELEQIIGECELEIVRNAESTN